MPALPQWEVLPEELVALREAAHPPRVIDCREEMEWHICRIEGAELLPMSSLAEQAAQKLLDKDQHLIIYCHHGMRSMHVVHWLREKGWENAQSLHGGIELWAEMVEPDMRRY